MGWSQVRGFLQICDDYWLTRRTAAAIQQVTKAIDYRSEDIAKMLKINYTGVFLAAQACAR